LTNEQYFHSSFPLRIFRQSIRQPVELHWHEFYELTLVLEGSGIHVLNGAGYPLGKGSLFLLTPADFHQLVPDTGSTLEVYNLIFSEEWIAEELYPLSFPHSRAYARQCDAEQLKAFAREMDRIRRECSERLPGAERIVRGALERILIDLGRNRMSDPPDVRTEGDQESYEPLRRALVYMQHHFREPLRLEDAARQARLSPNYFSETFRRFAGVSFQTYLQNLRLEFAKSLLRVSDLPVTDICHASGFGTLAHFERVFRRRTGHSPRSYRNQHRQQSGVSAHFRSPVI
jgi:AraC-like DNA-binding protein